MQKGFTLVEIMVVIGLAGIVAATGFVISISGFQRYVFNTERDLFVNLLQKARSSAMANIDELPHGLRIEDDSFVLFSGDDPNADGIEIDRNESIKYAGEDTFIFEQLSGTVEVPNSGSPWEVTLSNEHRTANVTVETNGRISW